MHSRDVVKGCNAKPWEPQRYEFTFGNNRHRRRRGAVGMQRQDTGRSLCAHTCMTRRFLPTDETSAVCDLLTGSSDCPGFVLSCHVRNVRKKIVVYHQPL